MKNRIIINVNGGVVQAVVADNPKDIEVIVFDNDNLEAEGKSSVQRERAWKKLTKNTEAIY